MKKINLVLLLAFSSTTFSQPTTQYFYYKAENFVQTRNELTNSYGDKNLNTFVIQTSSNNIMAIAKSNPQDSTHSSDSTKPSWDFSWGFDSWYFIPLFAIEGSKKLSEHTTVSLQFASILLHNDLACRIIYKPQNSSGPFYGGGVHRIINILAGTGTFFAGSVGYEWITLGGTRIGGEIRFGPMWTQGEGIDLAGDPMVMISARLRWD